MPGRIVVVTGPPAAGKTTLAQLLAPRAELGVHLHADDFWGFVASGYVDPWLPGSHAQNEVVIRAVAAAGTAFAQGGYRVVLDGVVGPWFLDLLRSVAAVPIDYLVLLPPLPVVLDNLTGRTGHGFTSVEATRKMYGEFERSVTAYPGHVLDPSGAGPQELCAQVEALLRSGRLALA